MLEDGECLVEVLEQADDCIVFLHIFLSLLHRNLGVEAPVNEVLFKLDSIEYRENNTAV